ncbi:two-component system OmpR family response regulator [Caballeronia udeis]|uniref:Two-component system OmpR family response regulator n=1 Tax=Caballeronia udeis TaxID=1232866 RepID=A0ABW8MW92_9BURK
MELRDANGLTMITTMQRIGLEAPILVISGISSIHENVHRLRAGAEDYLTRPFFHEEMSARIEVLLRRRHRIMSEGNMLRVGALELDLLKRKIRARQREIALEPTDPRARVHEVLTRAIVLEAVWGFHFDPQTNRIDVHIGKLRKKIGVLSDSPMTRAIRGAGYLLS